MGLKSDVQLFLDFFVTLQMPDRCVSWPFARLSNGRGVAWNSRTKKNDKAHRVLWELKHGEPFPSGMEARHSCGNGHEGCVNLDHVVPGTRRENFDDRYGYGTAKVDDAIAKEIIDKVRAGRRPFELAPEYGVNRSYISRLCSGAEKSHLSVLRKQDWERCCEECGVPIEGRLDKRYCGSRCYSVAYERRIK